MTVIRIEMVPGRPPLWRAWPEGRPELALEAASAVEAIGGLIFAHQRMFDIEILNRLTPAGHIKVR